MNGSWPISLSERQVGGTIHLAYRRDQRGGGEEAHTLTAPATDQPSTGARCRNWVP